MSENILSKELEGELMLYDTEQDKIHVLNDTARLIHDLYKEGKTSAEIEEAVKTHFQDKENEDIGTDVQKCLEELRKKGLLD